MSNIVHEARLLVLGAPAYCGATARDAVARGSPEPFPPERLYQMAVYVACRADWQSREHLTALLWPELDSGAARRNLRKLLFRAARSLPAELPPLESRADAVRWAVDTDLSRFETACRDGRWSEAIELARGTFADGFERNATDPFVEWLRAERSRVAALLRSALTEHLGQLETAGDRAALARRWLDAEPNDEDAIVALLDALLAQDRAAEAHRMYAEFERRLADEFGVEPSARVRRRMQSAPATTASAARATARAAAPRAEMPADGFVGRAHELAELTALLSRSECRLLTVTGPGGVGKSRLVKQVLRRLPGTFPDGVTWIALDDLTTSTQAVARIANELAVPAGTSHEPLQRVCRHLASRRALLVLDNSEHLTDLVGVVERLLMEAPRLSICATSRARLGARGEWLLPLSGLSVALATDATGTPDPLGSDAAHLFVAAATTARPDFDARKHAAGVGAVVRAVGGLPLATLLAAHWVRLLPVSDIAAELERSLDILESSDEGEERPEHRSVRATFDQSWRLLAPAEQQALAALSIFAGSFSRVAAQAVGGVVLPLLAALADKSLLQLRDDGRCELHPLIRQFAAEKLARGGDADAVTKRHAEYFCGKMGAIIGKAAEDLAATVSLSEELSDALAALKWARHADRPDLVGPAMFVLAHFFSLTSRAPEGLALLSPLPPWSDSGSLAHTRACAQAAIGHATLLTRLTRFAEALDSARIAFRCYRAVGDTLGIRFALSVLATVTNKLGRHTESRRFCEQGLRAAERAHDQAGVATFLNNLGQIENELDMHDIALARYERALAINRAIDNSVGAIAQFNNIGSLHIAAGRPRAAMDSLHEGLKLVESSGFDNLRSYFLANLARAHCDLGELNDARFYAEECTAAARAASDLTNVPEALIVLARIDHAEGRAAAAFARLREAAPVARSMRHPRSQFRCVIAHGRLLTAEGRHAEAARFAASVVATPGATPRELADAKALCAQSTQAARVDAASVRAWSLEEALVEVARIVG